MAVSVEVPDLGPAMAGGVVAEWYLPDGAPVSPGDIVCRVECDFVAVDVEAERPGLLRHQKPAGSIERPGAVLGLILEPGEAIPSEPAHRPVEASEFGEDEPLLDDEAAAFLAPDAPVDAPAFEESPFEFEPQPEAKEEFEEALAEAVVVPFPRRFTPAPGLPAWGEAPGDSVEFRSSLFEPVDEVAETLPEPGGSIPGLMLWEPEEKRGAAPEPIGTAKERFSRIAAEASASAQVLTMTVAVDVAEARNLARVSRRKWGGLASVEDVAVRAIALALGDRLGEGCTAGIVLAELESDVSCAVREPGKKPFKDAVTARCDGGDAPFEDADWVFVSLAALGVGAATARLDGGRAVSFAMGTADGSGSANVTIAYDSGRWSEGSAARMLARFRDFFEAPYGMLI